MTKKNNIRGILLSILAAIIAFLIIAAIAVFGYYRFYIMPKYNQAVEQGGDTREELKSEDIFTFAKYFSNTQFLDNLKNFDKSAAPAVIEALNELEQENPAPDDDSDDSKTTAPAKISDEEIRETSKNVSSTAESSGKKSAYDRIMASADKDEIMAGMSIISKVDISKVNKLKNEGKTSELKSYIKSVLSPSEISTSLKLYNKYKHLL
mgnify:CR=1 FL=1